MAESQTKPDTASEKASAEASRNVADVKDTSVDLKAVEKAVEAAAPDAAKSAPVRPAPAKAAEVAKAVVAKKKPVSKTTPKTASKTTAAKKKARAAKPASQKPAPAKKPAQPRNTPITKRKDTNMATANKATDFTATAKEAASEMQNRAKAAYEKGTALTGEATEFTKGNVEALVETGKLLASGMQDMGRTYMEDARTAADTVTEDVKKMAAIKSPTELFQLQGEIARRNFDAAVAQTSKNTEAMMKLVTEAFAPLSNRASVAAEKVSNAA
ncbi:hypothetical protein A9995_07250 [Erythrobacter sp. QSSC1-22B]|uniref:phasin family protein n=1 Tax=Erythrobacter sp. QSSC1-22B TaxID=1860125 RepID=UPI0008055426|nr:phasin family protein [Erythrobacter sp. QSSC1-22B]OBX19537.1 hypothetical protein A9995_07250 [Erythrobacter sp. QSSC1-22B]